MVADHEEHCYQAVQSRDPRFDGWFFTAVTSTGIYCRPSCPATTPKREHVRFYPSAAAAQQAGFRACKRCRPDATPGSPAWDRRGDVVARAMRLIGDGALDRNSVAGLAGRLGYSVRQLERLLLAEVGAGPIALARAQRAQTARVLIETTALTMTDVAFASGFSSIRQFNDTIRAVFAEAPSELRRRRGPRSSATNGWLLLKLPFRRPLSPGNLFGHLAATAVPGVEEVRDGVYRRTLRLPHGPGIVELTPQVDHVTCRLALRDLRDLALATARSRWLLDLDADPEAVDERLAVDEALRTLVAHAPGRRVPRCVDGAEMAIRAVIGQQLSTAAARTVTGSLVRSSGRPVEDPHGGLTHLFPTPEALEGVRFAMPRARGRSLAALLSAISSGDVVLDPGCDRDRALSALDRLPGIGPWTRAIIAMRALGDPDAFPASDLGVRRGAEAAGLPGDATSLTRHAETWRPWRAYAVQYLWSSLPHPINDWPPGAAPVPGLGMSRRAA